MHENLLAGDLTVEADIVADIYYIVSNFFELDTQQQPSTPPAAREHAFRAAQQDENITQAAILRGSSIAEDNKMYRTTIFNDRSH